MTPVGSNDADIAIDDFVRAHSTCVEALRTAIDQDWSTLAGSLVWSAAQTAAHLTDVLFSYAFQAAAHDTRGVLPFEELRAGPGAEAEALVDGIRASGMMLSSVLRSLPDGATSTWFGRPVAAPEWAAMGTRETLLHTYDIAVGLGVDLTPPSDIATRAYEAWDPRPRVGDREVGTEGDMAPPDDPWAALVRASERPFSDDEWRAWQTETNERRARPAPAGSEPGVLGDFADGTIAAPFGPGWRVFTDERLGGRSSAVISVSDGGPPGLAHGIRVEGIIGESDAGLNIAGATFLAADREAGIANLSAWNGLRFWVRGVMFDVDTAPGAFWFELGDIRLYSA